MFVTHVMSSIQFSSHTSSVHTQGKCFANMVGEGSSACNGVLIRTQWTPTKQMHARLHRQLFASHMHTCTDSYVTDHGTMLEYTSLQCLHHDHFYMVLGYTSTPMDSHEHLSVVISCVSGNQRVVVPGLQDEHILARKYADKWMAKALGMGLFKRRLYRKEVEDTRQLLFSSLNPLAKVSCCLQGLGCIGFRC